MLEKLEEFSLSGNATEIVPTFRAHKSVPFRLVDHGQSNCLPILRCFGEQRLAPMTLLCFLVAAIENGPVSVLRRWMLIASRWVRPLTTPTR
jgi:hypothetical protein